MIKLFNDKRLLLVILLTVIFFAYKQTFVSIIELWNTPSGTYGHGFLIFGISLYILYQQRSELVAIESRPFYLGIIPVLLLSLLYLSGIDSIRQLSVPLLLISLVLFLYGVRFAIKVVPAILFLYLALPGWGALVPYLQGMTVYVVKSLLSALTIPAHVYNVYVELPYGTFEIAEGCSGLRYFVVGVALSILYGVSAYSGLKQRLSFIVAGILISIFANWVRVFTIIYAGYQTKMQHSLVVDGHYYFGWGVFMILMAPLLYLSVRKSRQQVKVESEEEQNHAQQRQQIDKKSLLVFAVALMSLSLVPALEYLQKQNSPDFSSLELDLDKVRLTKALSYDLLQAWTPVSYAAQKEFKYQYATSSKTIDILVSIYANKTEVVEMANKSNQLETGGWLVVKRGKPEKMPVNRLVMQSSFGKQRLVYYWYNVNGYLLANKYVARLLQSLHKVFGLGHSSIYYMSTDCLPLCSGDEMEIDIVKRVLYSSKIN